MPAKPRKPRASWPALVTALADLRSQLSHMLAFSFAINLLVLAVPIFMIQVFDRMLAGDNLQTLSMLAVGTVAALMIMGALDLVRSRILARAGKHLERGLSPELLADGGEARLVDVGRLRTFLTGPMMAALLDAPWIPIFLIAIFLLHPLLGWVVAAGVALLAAMALGVERLTRIQQMEIRHAEQILATLAKQFKDPDGSIHAMGLRGQLRKRWLAAHDALTLTRLRHNDRMQSAVVTAKLIRLLLQIGLMATAAMLVVRGDITPGAMIAASVLAARALSPVERAQETWRTLLDARAALGRLAKIKVRRRDERRFTPRPEIPILDVRDLALGDVRSQALLFSGISFSVTGGELFGVTGPSGSGKSALAKLLVGLEAPTAGRVTLNRQSIAQLTLDEARDDIAFLPQRPELLSGTIADNISRFGNAELPEIDAAARLAGIEDAILGLPFGYATEVGPGGENLPQGVVQGILLARTFFASPRLIVMDEPYTFLDNRGIRHLIGALDHFRKMGSAVVVVSQRPSVLAHCDRVLVLEGADSRVVGRRTKAELRVLGAEDADDEPAAETSGRDQHVSLVGE